MTSIDEDFKKAVEDVKTLTKRPTDEELLEIYALFKQATEGDNTTAKPSMFNLKAKYKWECWTKLKGTSSDQAKQDYVKKVQELLAKYQ
ncbi:hypothetical protein M8J75_004833 [Diaphorina citri]|nr:hypothetical protein M8J75_004833 [Diaphorina citri]KAI5718457.1 hypothetical protein M8J77_021472 [Diaphorina citri]